MTTLQQYTYNNNNNNNNDNKNTSIGTYTHSTAYLGTPPHTSDLGIVATGRQVVKYQISKKKKFLSLQPVRQVVKSSHMDAVSKS